VIGHAQWIKPPLQRRKPPYNAGVRGQSPHYSGGSPHYNAGVRGQSPLSKVKPKNMGVWEYPP